MNPFAIIFSLLSGLALLIVPRRWAPLPFLMGACYMTMAQRVEVGPFSFTVIRMLLVVGFIRVLFRREKMVGGIIGLDWAILAWGIWTVLSGFFYDSIGTALVFRLGLAFQTVGFYFLVRRFCQSVDDVVAVIKITALLLVPVAFEMVLEQVTSRNLFAVLGGVPDDVAIRNDRLRAQGPFLHPILAGTVGAVCIPLMIAIWQRHRLLAKIGLASCGGMVLACASSGPLMSVIFSAFALVIWRWRHLTGAMRWGAVALYVLLEIFMTRPAYFIIQKFDLTGSSTGWHRAELIRSALEHLNEWWLAGTDYTRHWMPTGVSWSEDHADITNQYIFYGVTSGLLASILFVAILWVAFVYVGRMVRNYEGEFINHSKFIWILGASLFAHAASCISVYYFDQSFIFLFLTLAVIGSLYASIGMETESVSEDLVEGGSDREEWLSDEGGAGANAVS